MDHIEINKKITKQNIEDHKRSDKLDSVIMNRCEEEYEFLKPYLNEGDWILDVGVRYGHMIELLQSKGYNVIGTDISPEAVQMCWENEFDVVESDVHNMKGLFIDNYFDAVMLIHVLEHCIDPNLVLSEVYRVIKPDGIIFVEVPIQVDESPELWGHYHCFGSEEEVIKIVEERFTVIDKQSMSPPSLKPWFRCVGRKE